MMKTNKQLKAGALALLAGLYSAAAFSASYDGVATATIVAPITLTAGADMSFGSISAGTAASTVNVSSGNLVAVTVGDAVVTDDAGAALTFALTAALDASYSISIADGVLGDGGTNTMTVSNFVSSGNLVTDGGDGSSATGTGTGNPETVTVSADLAVAANQPAGDYSTANGNGTPIVITADYQ